MANNNQTYPELNNIKDPAAARVIRTTFDILRNLQDNAKGPSEGTINPDTKPRYGAQDVGRLFYATDFNRIFKWTGTSWTDAPGQDTRGRVSFFPPNTNPGVGWARCNSNNVFSSTPLGNVTKINVGNYPTTNGLIAWIRL